MKQYLYLRILDESIKTSPHIMIPVLKILEDMKLVLKVHEELLTSASSHIMIPVLKKLEDLILIFKVI